MKNLFVRVFCGILVVGLFHPFVVYAKGVNWKSVPDDPIAQCRTAIAGQINPFNTATLSRNAMAPRLKRILFWLYQGQQAGKDPRDLLMEAMNEAHAGKKLPLYYWSPELVHKTILDDYRAAQTWGLFSNRKTLASLRRGKAVQILNGPLSGQVVEVDHRLAVALAPELANNFANLRLVPQSINRTRGARVDRETIEAAQSFRREFGWLPTPGSSLRRTLADKSLVRRIIQNDVAADGVVEGTVAEEVVEGAAAEGVVEGVAAEGVIEGTTAGGVVQGIAEFVGCLLCF